MAAGTTPIDIGDYKQIKLWQNAKGIWEIRYFWPGRYGPSRGTKKPTTSTADFALAQTRLAEFCEAARQELKEAEGGVSPTLEVMIEKWLRDALRAGKSKTNGWILNPVRAALGRYTAEQLAAGGGALIQEYQDGRRVTSGTLRRELNQLRAVLRWALKKELIPEGTRLPKFDDMPADGPPRTKYLDHAQRQWFWDQARGWAIAAPRMTRQQGAPERVALFIAIAMETAARRGAIMDLTWDRVDMVRGLIDFQVPGKRVTCKRRVKGMPISDDLMTVLKEAWAAAPKDPSGRAVGRVIAGTRDISPAFNTFRDAIGMEWVSPHVLRHTWASLAAMDGVSMKAIAEVLGDSVAMVDKHYAHLSPEHMRSVVNRPKRPGLVVISQAAE